MSHAVKTTQLTNRSSSPVVVSTTPLEPVACWREIGVFGDKSCPELNNYVHCHNCPAHSAAGLQLLNRPLPQGYRREQTDYFARQHGRRDISSLSAVLFRVGAEWLALPTRILQEATEYKKIHSLPHRRHASILGLANVRGELMICLSLPHLLGLKIGPTEPSLHSTYDRLLVVQSGSSRLAFPVNEVHGPHRFNTEEMKRLSSKPRTSALASSQALLRWQDRAVGLLDSDALLAICQRSFR